MMKKSIDNVFKEKFKFLENEYDFQIINCENDRWGYELLYKNKFTAVKVVYEYRDAYIHIKLYRLVNSEIIENPGLILKNSVLHVFGLDDIISSINPEALIKPVTYYGVNSKYYDEKSGIEEYVTAFANNLKTYGKKVLQGDFTIFNKLDEVVKKRVIENE